MNDVAPHAPVAPRSESRPALKLAARHTADAPGHAVRIRGLTRRFGQRAVIQDLDLDIRAGEFVALIGRSGCGKSTLLRVLAGLDQDVAGAVQVARRRAVAFQAPRLMPWKPVWRNVALALPGRPDRARALRALAEVGLSHRSEAWPKALSGGEAQRASLARALIREPDLLLLDEPFGALDALTRIKAQALVGEIWTRHRCAVLLVTHDVEEALLLADRVLVMDDGVIAHEISRADPRPRAIDDPGFAAARARLLGWLGVPPAAHAPAPPAAQEPAVARALG